ncbi:MAG: putative transposase, partial [Gammaproteobacteria bacterium]
EVLKSGGVKTVKLPARSPNSNAYAQQFVRSIKSECLAHAIPLGEHHFRTAVKAYTEHYHFERNHQALNNQLFQEPPGEPNQALAVGCQERLGGILKYDLRCAA